VAGYRALPAKGGLDALRQVKACRPDLVVIDLSMLHTNALDVIAHIKRDAETAHVPVLALTVSHRAELTISAGRAGCEGYVSQPLQAKTLPGAVERLITQSRPPSPPDGGRPDTTPDLCA